VIKRRTDLLSAPFLFALLSLIETGSNRKLKYPLINSLFHPKGQP